MWFVAFGSVLACTVSSEPDTVRVVERVPAAGIPSWVQVGVPPGYSPGKDEQRAARLLGLTPPVSVLRSDVFRDFGSRVVVLRGATGRELGVVFVNEIRVFDPVTREWTSMRQPRVELDVESPGQAGGRVVGPASSEAAAALRLARLWLTRELTDAELAKLENAPGSLVSDPRYYTAFQVVKLLEIQR